MTTLTMQDEKRLDVIQRVYRGELTVVQAALVMGVSERQCCRVKSGSGRPGRREWFTATGNGKRKIKEKVLRRVVELARGSVQMGSSPLLSRTSVLDHDYGFKTDCQIRLQQFFTIGNSKSKLDSPCQCGDGWRR